MKKNWKTKLDTIYTAAIVATATTRATKMKSTALLYISLFLTLVAACSQPDNQEEEIESAFMDWQQTQIDNKQFVTAANCNYEYVISHPNQEMVLGFPNSFDINYADINGDKRIDGLVTFFPNQCDGGNMTAWIQYKLVVLSSQVGYIVNDSLFDKIRLENESAFFHLDSIDTKFFYGTYFDFLEDDGYCCPSIQKPIRVDFQLMKIDFIQPAQDNG